MSTWGMVFPMVVKQGSVSVKIYDVENKGRLSYTVSFHAGGKRRLKMFADFDEAYAEAKAKANALSRGEMCQIVAAVNDAGVEEG
jgi:hypothetical protein